MKKMLYIIIGVIGIFFVIGIVISIIKPQAPKISSNNKFVYGPYACNNKTLTIEQTFNANRLEGASSLADITVTYGDLVFKEAYTFQSLIEQKIGKTLISSGGLLYESDAWNSSGPDYFSSTQKSVTLPSQEELMSRGLKPDEKGLVILATASATTENDLQAFAECFNQNKKLIYDQETDGSQGNPPYFLWYYKAYLIKI
jgi:hypothetical protein